MTHAPSDPQGRLSGSHSEEQREAGCPNSKSVSFQTVRPASLTRWEVTAIWTTVRRNQDADAPSAVYTDPASES